MLENSYVFRFNSDFCDLYEFVRSLRCVESLYKHFILFLYDWCTVLIVALFASCMFSSIVCVIDDRD